MLEVFKKLGEIATGAKHRHDVEYSEFMTFYRTLVETLPPEACDLFEGMNVRVKEDTVFKDWKIQLDAADYIFWKNSFHKGVVFAKKPFDVKSDMVYHMVKRIETQSLTAEERKAILDLIDPK